MSTVNSAIDKAIKAWGASPPDWVCALADACDNDGLRKTAIKLGLSPAMASLAINKKRSDFSFIKDLVEEVLMINKVNCKVYGEINYNECLNLQKREFSAANPLSVQLYKACRNGCIYYKK